MTPAIAPRRVLVVALDNLGDLVFASALTPPLHAAFPDATIDVWCKAYTADVARLAPHVANVVAADPPWAVPKHLRTPPLGAFITSLNRVRAGRYDVALLTGSPWRTAAAVAAARIPMRIGLARRHNHRFLTHVLPAEDDHKPVVREQSRLLEPLGVPSIDPHYVLDASRVAEVVKRVQQALPPHFVALHPFASDPARCVPLAEWLRVADLLRARGESVLWIGMPEEMAALRRDHRHPADAYVDQLGESSLRVTAAALSRATMLVGHDSGPMHVGAAFGVPVVGIFAPGQPQRTFPQGPGPWRMIHRPTPTGITAEIMLREMDDLGLSSSE